MFTKFEIFVGFRYLKAKQKNSFISFISLVSIIGIALGVATLITVLSVMNGFQREIKNKIIDVTAHMRVMDLSGKLHDWQLVAKQITNLDKQHIVSYAPYIDGQALISYDGVSSGVMLRGIDVNLETQVENLKNYIIAGEFSSLTKASYNIIIGNKLAEQLGASLGDYLTIIIPDSSQLSPIGITPRIKKFKITAIFNMHMAEYDTNLVFTNIYDAGVLYRLITNINKDNIASGIRFKLSDVMAANKIKNNLQAQLPKNLLLTDWTDQYQNYFMVVALEKRMMFLALLLIVAVAVFNLVSSLVMTVNDKKADIAILKTMGATSKQIRNIFIIQGIVSGILGAILGTVLGILLATNVANIMHFIEFFTHTKVINPDVYLIDYLPSQIYLSDIITIFVISVFLSILATIYPSITASKLDPVASLRYE